MATADQNGAHDAANYHHHHHHPPPPPPPSLYHYPPPPSAYVPQPPPPPPPPGAPSPFHHPQYHPHQTPPQPPPHPYGPSYNPYYGLYGQPTALPPNPYLAPPPLPPQPLPPPSQQQPPASTATSHYTGTPTPSAPSPADIYYSHANHSATTHISKAPNQTVPFAGNSQKNNSNGSNNAPSSSHSTPKSHSTSMKPGAQYPHGPSSSSSSSNNNNNNAQSMSQSAASKAANDSSRRRRTRCKKCESCLRADCGDCHFCKDMKKFGGPGRMKQSCIARQCLAPVLPHTACCIICGRDGWEKLSIDPSLAMDETASSLMECSQCWEIVHPFCLSETNVDLFQHNKGYINKELPNSWECPKCVRSGNTSKQNPGVPSQSSSTNSGAPSTPAQLNSPPHSKPSPGLATPKAVPPKSINWSMMTENKNKSDLISAKHGSSSGVKRLRPDESPPPVDDDESKKKVKSELRMPEPPPGYFGANPNYNFPYNYPQAYTQSHTYPPYLHSHPSQPFGYPYSPYSYPSQYPPYHPHLTGQEMQHQLHSLPAPPPPPTAQLALPAPPPPAETQPILPAPQLTSQAPQSSPHAPSQEEAPPIKTEHHDMKQEPREEQERVHVPKIEEQTTVESQAVVEQTKHEEVKSTTLKTVTSPNDELLQDDSTADSSVVSNSISDQNIDSTGVSESEISVAEEVKKDIVLKKPLYVVRPSPIDVSSESDEESDSDDSEDDDSATEEEGDSSKPEMSSEEKSKRRIRAKKIKKALKMFDRTFPENLAYEKDVITPVLKYLDRPELLKCMAVCKQWNDWCHDPLLWRSVSLQCKRITSIILIGIVRRQPKHLDLSFSILNYEQLQWLLPRLPQMQSLKLVSAKASTVHALHTINCPRLSCLDLSFTRIGDDQLKLLLSKPNDKRPGLMETKTRLRFLSEIKLAGTDISDVSVRLMMLSLPFLEKLDISECPLITDNGISALVLSKGDRLIELYLSRCDQISDASLRLLKKCKLLEVLDLRGCPRISQEACDKFACDDEGCSNEVQSTTSGDTDVSGSGGGGGGAINCNTKPVNIKKKYIHNFTQGRGKWMQKESKYFVKHRTSG